MSAAQVGVWSECLWDTHPNLFSFSKFNADFLKSSMDFLERRCKIEEKYTKDLKKLCKEFKPKDFRKDEKVRFSVQEAMLNMLNEIESIANQHDSIRDDLVKHQKEIKAFMRDLQKRASETNKQLSAHSSELERAKSQLNSVRAQYMKSMDEMVKSKREYEAAKDNPEVPQVEAQRFQTIYRQRETVFEDRKNTLAKELSDFNQLQRQVYTEKMPKQFNKYEDLEREFCAHCKNQFTSWSNVEINSLHIQMQCANSMLEHTNIVDADKDIRAMLDITMSGDPVPGDLAFEDVADTPKHGSSESINRQEKSRGLFGTIRKGLGPAQQKRKLEAELNDKQSELDKAMKEKAGIEKMMNAPKTATSPELQRLMHDTCAKIDQLQVEYNALLKDLEALGVNTSGKYKSAEPKQQVNNSNNSKTAKNAFDDEFDDETPSPSNPEPAAQSSAVPPPPPPPPPQLQQGPQPVIRRMMHTFDKSLTPDMADAITVECDEEVEIIQDEADDWSLVKRVLNGETGYVPTNYMQ